MMFGREELLAIEKLKLRLRQLEAERSEPIAIIGASARLPGCDDIEALWALLARGGDAITSIHAHAGARMPCGYIDTLESFDAEFFRMSPREVLRMDARQRLVLEASWEALERAGIPGGSLENSRTGVYVGASGISSLVGGEADAHDITGSLAAVVAGRVSYFLGLRGPCLAIDTACSSSLVALHLACKALRAGECTLALAGGVGVLSRTRREGDAWLQVGHLGDGGRCRPFDAAADGIVGSDGVAMMVLKRLSAAVHDGDPILAVIRGSAINHDGRAQGLTVPSGVAQEDVLRRALAEAKIDPRALAYIECHGTGTPLGDPIEVQAIGNVFAARTSPLRIGSIKSNLGHTDAAAGIVGLTKVVLAMQHERIPRTIHFATPTPHIAWDELPVEVVGEDVAWPRGAQPRLAGVSSFGISGTNAHIVIEEPPVAAETLAPARAAEVVVVSARTEAALAAAVARLRAHVETHALALGDIAASLATRRTHHEHRFAVAASTRDELIAALAIDGGVRGVARRGKTAWLFTGQGAQVVGMGRELAASSPVFADALNDAIAAVDKYRAGSLREAMWSGTREALARTGTTQPAMFVLEVALAAQWRAWGVQPDVVMGHSVGEIAAAHVAGVFSLDDAARLIVARGQLMEALPAGGAMWSIAASEDEVAAAIAGHANVAIGAINGPASIVISGDATIAAAIAADFAARGVRTKQLEVSHAFHSPRMDAMLAGFAAVAETVAYRAPATPLVSNVRGAVAGDEIATASYWVAHAREAVRFADGVRALQAMGVVRYVEIGPKPTLLGMVPGEAALISSLRPERAEHLAMLDALGALHVHGGAVDWTAVFPVSRAVPLPTYAWQRQRYWIDEAASGARAGAATAHPLLGVHVALAGGATVYEQMITRTSHAWLYDHEVAGRAVIPGAGLVELARAAADHHFDRAAEVRGLVLQAPLVLPERGGQRVQVVLADDGARCEASIYSQAESATDGAWILHATAEVRGLEEREATIDVDALRARCTEAVAIQPIYDGFAATGLIHRGAFRGLTSLWRGRGEAIAELVLPADDAEHFGVHPALLDAAFHATIALGDGDGPEGLLLPFAMDRLAVHAPGAQRALAHVRRRSGEGSVVIDVTLCDARGRVLVELTGLHGRRADGAAIAASGAALDDALPPARYRMAWPVVTSNVAALADGRWLVIGRGALADEVMAQLVAAGRDCARGAAADAAADHVVCAWGAGEANTAEALAVVQALAAQPARLWWITQGAISVAGESADAHAATLWGLGRTVAQELPELGCTLIDAPVGDVDAAAAQVVRELGSTDDEREVAWREGARHVARIVRSPDIMSTHPLRLDGAVLITGGLGALGLHVARWLAQRGVPHLVLLGRRGLETPGAADAVRSLEALGARVTVAAVDASDRIALTAVLNALGDEPLRGVIHAAGVLDDGVLREQTAARFARVLDAKLTSALHLDALTRDRELDVFALFSSTAGTLGAAGQAPYAAANAGLDALASARRAAGLPGQSLAWGAWRDGGMAASLSATHQARLARQGVTALSAAQGIALLAQVLGADDAQTMLLPIDLRAARQALGETIPPVWRSLIRAPRKQLASAATGAWAHELAAIPAERRRAAILDVVRAEVARVLSRASAREVDDEQPLQMLGLDSLMAVELRNALGKRAGATLPATLAFDYPTPSAIARYLHEQVLVDVRAPVVAAPVAEATDEPIAIVGMGCRYPGGITDPASLWALLAAGGDGVIEVPPERWDIDALYDPDPDAPGKTTCREGGFLRGIEQFDPAFFGISPREATSMDPQQRLLLETSWEALESAGIVPSQLVGSATGVFVGLMYQEYALKAVSAGLDQLDGYVGTGTASSVAAGRISYTLGLQGPAMTVDTACSSSLVTAHLACQSLRAGECSLALAGGAAIMLLPGVFVEFSRLRGLSPDGRCKSFSADANGVGWAEGCGMLVLERLSDARKHGHPVLGVIRGSAVNQDGRSNGLTAPNGPSQEAVIRRALHQAGVRPADVQYVECHGTGTSLGDPIEVQSLGNVLGEGRDDVSADDRVWIGSIKSNLGHTQAAAGAVGIMKVVLAMQHERIPRNIHFAAPSPHIAWDELPVRVVTDDVAWPRGGQRRIAGVSSFGVSGTNAHVVIEEPPAELVTAPMMARPEVVVVSARSEAGLAETAARLRAHVETHALALSDVAASLATRRTHHEHRLAVTASTRDELIAALDGGVRGVAQRGKTAWLFTGQGAQVVGMGREVAAASPVFAMALEEAIAAVDKYRGGSLREAMWHGPREALAQTGATQPAMFVLEVALAAQWRAWGVQPDVVMGHSVGEIAAAHVAGVFSLDDAARLIVARGRLMEALPAGGAMWSIAASEEDVSAAIEAHPRVSIGAINGAASIVISGDAAAAAAIAGDFTARGVRTKQLEVSHAFHSPQMDAMLADFAAVANAIAYRAPTTQLVSNVRGAVAGDEIATADYWVAHAREAVRFSDGVRALEALGVTRYLELGPKPTLLGLVPAGALIASLRPGRDEHLAMLDALGALHVHGGDVDWRAVFPASRAVPLPTYAWQRQRYWLDDVVASARAGEATEHPLLGVHVALAGGATVYESVLSRASHAWLYDHEVAGRAIVPGAGLAELLRAAADHHFDEAAEVRELVLQAPLALPARGSQRVQVVLTDDGMRCEASVYSQPDVGRGATWTLHASAEVRRLDDREATVDVAALRARCATPVDADEIYAAFAGAGLVYRGAFRALASLARGDGEVLATLALPESVGDARRFGVHPALLDAAFQATAGLDAARDGLRLPFAIDRLAVHAAGAREALAHVRRRATTGDAGFVIDATLLDPDGRVLVELAGLHGRRADGAAIAEAAPTERVDARFRVAWPVAASETAALPDGRWLVVGRGALADEVAARLIAAGRDCARAVELAPAAHVVCAWSDEASDEFAVDGLAMVQALAAQATPPRLWWVTQGAVSVAGESADPQAATLWGLGRTVAQELPELDCTLIDATSVDDVMRALAARDDEREIAWRAGVRHVARLVRAPDSAVNRALRLDGAVLITGGLGALGLHVARWLAQRGVPHLVLLGRRGLETPGAADAVRSLEALGARVTVAAVDASDRAALEAMLTALGDEPLRGVFHTAGVLDDGVLREQTAARFARVLDAKLTSARHLDALTRERDLDAFVLFSSTAGTFGAAGQAPYAAANAGLDALAASRRARGLPAQSLAWGAWRDGGMAASLSATHQARLARQGITALSAAQGIALLAQVLGADDAQLVLLPIDLRAARQTLGATIPPLWRTLVKPQRRMAASAAGAWAQELAAMPALRRRAAVAEAVRAEVARVLSLASPAEVDDERPLQALGLDSLMAVELRNALGKRAGATLPATLAFDHPTPSAIARYLHDRVLALADVASPAPPPPEPAPAPPALTMEAMAELSDEQAMARLQQELFSAMELP